MAEIRDGELAQNGSGKNHAEESVALSKSQDF